MEVDTVGEKEALQLNVTPPAPLPDQQMDRCWNAAYSKLINIGRLHFIS